MRKLLAAMLACLIPFGSLGSALAGEKKAADTSKNKQAVEDEATDSSDEESDEASDENTSDEKASESAQEQEDASPRFAEITTKTGTLNLRSKASASGKVTAKLPNHSKVRVMEESGDWTHVAFGAKTGYVQTRFLTPLSEEETAALLKELEEEKKKASAPADEEAEDEEASGDEASGDEGAQDDGSLRFSEIITKSGTLNLRKKADGSSKIVAKLPNQAKVRVLEKSGDWTHVAFGTKTGYVKTSYLSPIAEIPYETLSPGDKGDKVLALKKQMRKFGYLKSEEVNMRFDPTMEKALHKLQMINGIELSADITPELQALIHWGNLRTCKSGYSGTATDKDSGLTVTIFCWDSGGKLYEEDESVKVNINFVAQAMGGTPPYTVTVSKTLDADDGAESGDTVTSPFSFVYKSDCAGVYLWAVAEDANGNKVTTKARFRYKLPERYTIDPNAID